MLSLKGKFSTDSYNVRNMLGMYTYVHICTCSIKISVDVFCNSKNSLLFLIGI